MVRGGRPEAPAPDGREAARLVAAHPGVAQHLGTAAVLTDPLLPHDRVDTPDPADWARTVITAIRASTAPQTR